MSRNTWDFYTFPGISHAFQGALIFFACEYPRRRRKNWTGIDQNGYTTCVLRGHSVEDGCIKPRFASVKKLDVLGSRAVGLSEFQQLV